MARRNPAREMKQYAKMATVKFDRIKELNRIADDKDEAMDKRNGAKKAKRAIINRQTQLNGAPREVKQAVNAPSSTGDMYRGKHGKQLPVRGKEKRRHRLACSKA